MERYIQQLIEVLDQVANDLHPHPYYEIPPHLVENPEIAELALLPFKPISEWTGIDSIVFPCIADLKDDLWGRVNDAIFRVFESFHIELIDVPEDIPPEILYDILNSNWDYPVQYLPLSGFDLELCAGYPMTYPYGEFCNCNGDDEFFDDEEQPFENFDEVDDMELPF
jgi:hypothetical protein